MAGTGQSEEIEIIGAALEIAPTFPVFPPSMAVMAGNGQSNER